MIGKVKKYLKTLSKEEIKKIVQHPDLTECEKWLVYYTFGEQRMAANTCAKLGLGECSFYFKKQIALIKLYYILKV